jgi:hypothetical protein
VKPTSVELLEKDEVETDEKNTPRPTPAYGSTGKGNVPEGIRTRMVIGDHVIIE